MSVQQNLKSGGVSAMRRPSPSQGTVSGKGGGWGGHFTNECASLEVSRLWEALSPSTVQVFNWTALDPESLMGITQLPCALAFPSLKWTFPATLGQYLAETQIICCIEFGRCQCLLAPARE